MKVAVLWMGASGYSAACWNALAAKEGVELRIHVLGSGSVVSNTRFSEGLLSGLDVTVHKAEAVSSVDIAADLKAFRPNLTLVSGWAVKAYNEVIGDPTVTRGRLVVAVDNPWKPTLRQRASGLLNGRFLRGADAVLVPGERARQFVRTMRVPLERIHIGMYGFDSQLFQPWTIPETPAPQFLFVGRYVESKGIPVLLEAFGRYQQRCASPWSLTCSGTGALGELIRATPGVTDAGFNQPQELRELIESSGALVLPSSYEHWGVIVAEALACGRPVICSDTTGSIPELIRDRHNGLIFKAGDAEALAHALLECSSDEASWRRWAASAPGLTEAFTADCWADSIVRLARMQPRPGRSA